MGVALIEANELSKCYHVGSQELFALRDLTVKIDRGEFVAVIGPSGSGKSTLLNQIGCLDRPTSGLYRFDGTDISTLGSDAVARLRNRSIGFCFQSYQLLPRATALANVELPLLYADVAPERRHDRARDMLRTVGLEDRSEHLPTQLSGGEQQRVAIARALVNNPLLILADEPTGSLDSRTGLGIMALLQELNRSGLTVIIVTHDPMVARFADRVLSLLDGRLVDDHRATEPFRADGSDRSPSLARTP
jgi:putative ABC transport system ATP-binding protein